MNGGNTDKYKWADIELHILKEEMVSVMMLCETHLVGKQVPPRISGFKWQGSNRNTGPGRRGQGGVGILIAEHMPIERCDSGNDWVAVTTTIAKQRIVFVSIYMRHASVDINRQLVNELKTYITRHCGGAMVVVGGDWNAHISAFSEREDHRGRLLEQFALELGLQILNTTEKCQGRYTRQRAVLDYVLCSSEGYHLIENMLVDDSRQIYTRSDHNVIITRMKIPLGNAKGGVHRVTIVDTSKAAREVAVSLNEENTANRDYATLKDSIRRAAEKNSKRVLKRTHLIYLSREVREAVKARRAVKKSLKEARAKRNHRLVTRLEQDLEAHDQAVLRQKEKERAITERKQHDWILHAPRSERPRRFWGYVRKLTQKEPHRQAVTDTAGRQVDPQGMEQHLETVAHVLLNTRRCEEGNPTQLRAEDTGIRTNPLEVEAILGSMSSRTATGIDEIPASILKKLGDIGSMYIASLFNDILAGDAEIPSDWGKGRVSLLEKSSSKRGNLATYRPITISGVLYRMMAKIIGKRIAAWMEENEILGEMQNGFRTRRRGDDNIFMLTSMIEMARASGAGLICAFLDASRAYDRVNRDMLWRILDEHGMNPSWIKMIELLYKDNSLIIRHGEHTSAKLETIEGLRQGCPLSPILFALYIAELERRLLRANRGFNVQYWNLLEKKKFKIPGLLFADDLVLVGHTYEDLQLLLNVTTEVGDSLQLTFNPAKSAIVIFSKDGLGTDRPLHVQGKELPKQESYKYLGIVIDQSRDYLTEQSAMWEAKAVKVLRQLHAQSLWAFSRFEISRIHWKAVAVPSLTYGNAVTVMPRQTRMILEKYQRDAARWALGIPGHPVASEFLDAELQWSTFEKREAQSKISYFGRISTMPHHRWPRTILTMMETLGLKSRWYKRVEELKKIYRCKEIRVQLNTGREPRLQQYYANVAKRIKTTVTDRSLEKMGRKSSLETYRAHADPNRRNACVYTNDRGSSLLALARAGMLPTRWHRRHYEPDIQTHCIKCGMEQETVRHVILECNTAHLDELEFVKRLGLTEEVDHVAVRETKRTLRVWESETRTIR